MPEETTNGIGEASEQVLIREAALSKPNLQRNPYVTLYRGKTPFSVTHAEDCLSLYSLRKQGFQLRKSFSDGGARHVWVHPETLAIFTYCEGDLTLEVPVTAQAGILYLSMLAEVYEAEAA